MPSTGTLLVKYRLLINKKIKSTLKPLQNNPMSKALVHELDLKMQKVREYGLIAHGYHNENFQYPVHVRRSHDGEKLSRTGPIISNSDKKNRFSDSTNSTPSSHETRIKTKQKSDEHQTTLIVPPNKTINDINPSLNYERLYTHRKSSLSLTNSSPILYSIRPHSIAEISSSSTNDEQEEEEKQRNSLANSSHLLINQSPPIKTLTQRFFSKFFHQSS